ncbi:MAG TPA: alkaline phosphatase family protein [Candidatus Acidoferrales bacterium]|nr:alkaline phosphatase family protein [Candidatus Acidoferrales bacterium]
MRRRRVNGLRFAATIAAAVAMSFAMAATGQQTRDARQRKSESRRIRRAPEPKASEALLAELVRRRIKYVFVIYQENRSFDSYFGTFPGAEGIFSHSREATPGFTQTLEGTDGKAFTITPFRIGPAVFAADTADVNHSHPGILAKMDLPNCRASFDPVKVPAAKDCVAKMDKFAQAEEDIAERRVTHLFSDIPSLKAVQLGELTMAYEDCDTVPVLWAYAKKFVLFDHIFQLMSGPSTPGNLAILGAQSGVTQWVRHPDEAYRDNGGGAKGVPVMNDNEPFWGSVLDPTASDKKMAVNPADGVSADRTALNLTYATLPLTLKGEGLQDATKSDADAKDDLDDVEDDIGFISGLKKAEVPFGWFQEGYDKEPAEAGHCPADASGLHASYITHHNGPQYFGYISNNPEMQKQLHGLQDFFDAIRQKSLSASGVYFLKGGLQNLNGLKPSDPEEEVQKCFRGDDDHPGYSDAQISEDMVAEAVNRIAESPYWNESAVIITWDDSEGDYDHVPPPIRVWGPDGSPISDGPRVPLILISPYARAGYVSHAEGNHASVAKLIDAVFGLPPLATLPDESSARKEGMEKFGQADLGPEDAVTPDVTDLLDAFSVARLTGRAKALDGAYARIDEKFISSIPPKSPFGCSELGIVPTDRKPGNQTTRPPDFNPRPGISPNPKK